MLAITLLFLTSLVAQGPDRDGDGLSDFHELHKYMTDPDAADSDGDGTPDGDWFERREYAYTVRSVVHVVPVPVTPDVLCDDYQDARVLDRQSTYIELEVIHYPFNTVASAIKGDPHWREHLAGFEPYLQPGPSANWDAEMRAALIESLAKDGIDVLALDDASLVRKAAAWLMGHAKHRDLFTTFSSELGPDGSVRIHPELAAKAETEIQHEGLTVGQAMQRELFAKGMFENASRGSCTSSAIYLNGCLRALGIPTRIVLTIPVIDASDKREQAFVARLTHAGVRRTIQDGTSGLGNSWASHTYNEVYVGGRWRRLNYEKLGQNILDPDYFGLMTHVSTVSDWLDGGFARTIGVRQQRRPDDIFGGSNPYSCISLSDQFGEHCELTSPPEVLRKEHTTLTIERAYWYDSPAKHSVVAMRLDDPNTAGHLLVHVAEVYSDRSSEQYKPFYSHVSKSFALRSQGYADVPVAATRGFWGVPAEGVQEFYLRIEPADWMRMKVGVEYDLVALGNQGVYRWKVAEGVGLTRSTAEQGEPLPTVRTVARAVWSDDPGLPSWLNKNQKDLRLFIEPAEREEKWEDFKAFTARVDRRFYLEAPGQPRISLTQVIGGVSSQSIRFTYLLLGSSDLKNLRPDVSYSLRAHNGNAPYRWDVPEGLTVRR